MKLRIGLAALLLAVFTCCTSAPQKERPRIIVTSDGEIDDECSLVRFMLYMNDWDVEGIITSASQYHWRGHKWAGDGWMEPYLDAYEQIYPNLLKHDARYPSPEYVRSISVMGNVDAQGEMDQVTPGSELIVRVLLDESDDRPVWLQAWGGTNTIARALKTIQEEHPEKMAYVAAKARLYCIWEQDSTFQAYIRPEWSRKYGLKVIVSDQFVGYDYFWKRYNLPAEDSLYFDRKWMKENILKGHGPLCDLYKAHEDGDFRSEGDSPSYFYVIDNGLSDTEHPDWGNWGGRYVNVRENTWMDPVLEEGYVYPQGRWYTSSAWGRYRLHQNIDQDAELYAYLEPILRWLPAVQNDFAARADWCTRSYEEANHAPRVKVKGQVEVTAAPGETVSLDASRTTDPDKDALRFRWWYYADPSSYKGNIQIENADRSKASLTLPADITDGETLHVICEVSDGGTPSITRYARKVITVKGGKADRPRILISTDIGGTDPDDNQSMMHYLLFSNEFECEGLVSSPSYGSGSKEEILRMIGLYEQDLPALRRHASGWPGPDYLRSITKQGARGAAPMKGWRDTPTEGSEHIVKCALKASDKPLYVLVWGGLDDLAQALHDCPAIQDRIRVYWIGGPNKKFSINSYVYIVEHFPNLWFIENNVSYRGFIADGKVKDPYNADFYDHFVRHAGALGEDFINYLGGRPKLGDTPSLLYMMDGDPACPEKECQGGSFTPCNRSSHIVFDRPATADDKVQTHSVIEFRLKGAVRDGVAPGTPSLVLSVDGQDWDGYYLGDGQYMVRYATYKAGIRNYIITSDFVPAQRGQFTVENVYPGEARQTDYTVGDRWYVDRPDEDLYWKDCQGAQTVYKWRTDAVEAWGRRCAWLMPETAHVFIVAGQSNTDGRVPVGDLPAYIKAYASDTTFLTGAYPHCLIAQNDTAARFVPFWPHQRLGTGRWAYDAVTYYLLDSLLRQPFYVIKWAVGGTSIAVNPEKIGPKSRFWSADEAWLASTSAYEKGGHSLLLDLTQEIDRAVDGTLSRLPQGYQIDAFIWHQGESDAKYGDAYYDNLKGVVTYVRNHLSGKTGQDCSGLPFIFGTVARSNRQYGAEVEAAMRRFAAEDPNAYLIDLKDATLQGDKLHFDAPAAEDFGRRVFEVLQTCGCLTSASK